MIFTPLRRQEVARIVDLQLDRLRKRLADRQIGLEMSPQAREYVADEAYDPIYGARPLKRYVQQYIETPLAKDIIAGKVRDGQMVTVNVRDGELTFAASDQK